MLEPERKMSRIILTWWHISVVNLQTGVLRCTSELDFNTLNTELNPICHLLALLGAPHILHVIRIRVKMSETKKLLGKRQ